MYPAFTFWLFLVQPDVPASGFSFAYALKPSSSTSNISGLFSQYRRQKFTSLTNPFRDVHVGTPYSCDQSAKHRTRRPSR